MKCVLAICDNQLKQFDKMVPGEDRETATG